MGAQDTFEKLKAAVRKPDTFDPEWLVLVIVLALAGIVGVIAWALLVGGLLTLILPFRLFEAALLVMIASGLIVYVVLQFLRGTAPQQANSEKPVEIPQGDGSISWESEVRVAKADAGITWEVWFRAELAEALYNALRTPEPTLDMLLGESLDTMAGIKLNRARPVSDASWHETSIRLAEVITNSLRDNPPLGKRLKISSAELRAQMTRHNLPMVDEELLAQVAAVVNRQLALPEVANIVYQHLWDKPTSVFG
jgi:hypothetical protein